ncbi:MAG: response regulator [Lachnospiraceae bacterium]|nr:response regulator [Lachnospiraceae bacterium]
MEEKILLVSEKESFLIKALAKKLQEAGWETCHAETKIDDINKKVSEAYLAIYYLDRNEGSKADICHFLNDKLDEADKKLVLIGEKEDVEACQKNFSKEVLMDTFLRPLDNDQFLEYLKQKVEVLSQAAEQKKTILIVDDDTTYMGLIREWLRDTYQVNMANSGLQALKWLGANKADLILLDYEMPVTSGPQVLSMLRSESETRDIPVMFLTGKGDKESVMQVLSLKPEGYLLKSIEKEKLKKELAKFFS